MTSFAGPHTPYTLLADAQDFHAKNGGYSHISDAAAGITADANEAVFFDLELEHIKAKSYDVLRRELKHRTYIPVSFEAGPGAETIAYTQYDHVGTAKLISNYAEDLPLANVKGKKFRSAVEGVGIGFDYNLQEVRNSMMANKRLPDRKAKAAMRGNAETEEDLAAFGHSGLFNAFLNHPNVPIISAIDIGSSATRWIEDKKTADQMNDDVALLVRTIVDTTNEVEKPDTLLLPVNQHTHISSKRVADIPETFLSWLLRTSPYIRNVGTWNRLKTADEAGTGPRAMAYDRNPDKVTLEIPQDFEMLPAQAKNLSWLIPCHSRFGGVLFYYPLSACYMDDI